MYQAIVSRVSVYPHPNADKLSLGNVRGYQVVVGKDTQEGTLGIYFPTDGQLSEQYCQANDLIRRKDENGNNAGGMFDANRRVRSQKLRGERSEGYFASLESLAFTGVDISTFKEGDLITEVNGVPICNKYETPATIRARTKRGRVAASLPNFPKHVDTDQLRFAIENIPADSLVIFMEKKHGTSARMGHILVDTERKWWQIWKPKKEYRIVHGSRNVLLKNDPTSTSFRQQILNDLAPHIQKGEVLYGEIVGYDGEAPIMPQVSVEKLQDKSFVNQYGKDMVFKYNCKVGQCEFWLYRVAHMNEDGVMTEMPWFHVEHRAKQLGVKAGPVMHKVLYDGDKEKLLELANSLVEGPSLIDDSHIREGVIVQVESPSKFTWLKHKSFTFGVLEGYIKEQNQVDLEEAS